MKEVFKEMWNETSHKVRLTIGIVFSAFIILCIWATLNAKQDAKVWHNEHDEDYPKVWSLVD